MKIQLPILILLVTEIRQKIDGRWKIKHLHSTVNKTSNTNP